MSDQENKLPGGVDSWKVPSTWEERRTSNDMAYYLAEQNRKEDEGMYEPLSVKDAEDCKRAAQIIMDRYHFAFVDGLLRVYEHGVFTENGLKIVARESEKLIENCTRHLVSEIAGHLERLNIVDADRFDNYDNLINLANGVFNLDTYVFEAHENTPKYYFTKQIPNEYHETATCKRFLKLLMDILPNRADSRLFLDMFASCITAVGKLRMLFCWIGSGSNGKGVLTDIVTNVLGEENVGTADLSVLADNRFGTWRVYKKYANFSPDVSTKQLEDEGILKSIIAGDRVDYERKHHDAISAWSNTRFFVAANEFPRFKKNPTKAMIDRFVFLEFPKKFREPHHTDADGPFDGMADPELVRSIIEDPIELSGIINLLLPVCDALRRKCGFDFKGTTHEKVKQSFVKSANTIESFIIECIDETDAEHDRIEKGEFHRAYTKWCMDNHLPTIEQGTLTRKIGDRLSSTKSNAQHLWTGVRFKVDKAQQTTLEVKE